MTTGQQLNMIEMQLRRLRVQVEQVRLNALGAGESPGAGTPGDPSLAARLRRLGREFTPILLELDRICHQLEQIETSLEWRDRIAWRLGREQRYSARQSVRDHQAHGRAVYQLVEDIRAAMDRIVGEAGNPTERERIELINDAMEKVSEFAGHMHEAQALLSQPAGPAIAPANVTVNVSLPGLLLTIYVLMLYLVRKGGGKA